MATVTRESIGNLHDKLTVKLSKEDYLPSFEKSLKTFAKTANVPGFRKGMVPAGMVKKMYGQTVFQDEVIRTASRQLEDYMKGEQLAIFGQPMMLPPATPQQISMNEPGDVDFTFEVGLMPEITIPALENPKPLTRYKINVADKMIDDEIDRITKRFGKTEPKDAVESKEDVVTISTQPSDATGTVAEGTEKKEGVPVLLSNLPVKLQEELMGKKAEDTVLFTPAAIATAEELPNLMRELIKADMAAAEHPYVLTIDSVSTLIPHELNAELYLQVFPNEAITEEREFRSRLRDELSKEFDRIAGERMNNELFELLVHDTPIQLPHAFLKRWVREGGEKPVSEAEVEKEFPAIEHNLRWQLISDKLIRENGLSVSREEVMNNIKSRVLAYFGMEAGDEDEAPWMDGYMQKVAKDEKTMNETYQRMLNDRLFEFLQSKFPVEEKEIGEEEFFKLPHPHDAHHHHHSH